MFRRSLIRKLPSAHIAPAGHPKTGTRFQVEALEDRTVPSTLTVGSGSHYQYQSIAAALAAAPANSTIEVFAGTYTQPLTISKNGITLVAEGPGSVQVAPSSTPGLVLNGIQIGSAAIDITGKNVTVQGITVNGAGDQTDGNLWAGIRVIEGGSATLNKDVVENILYSSNSNSNVGIAIGIAPIGASLGAGKATIENDTITQYGGAGIDVDGTTASAAIFNNTITGIGTQDTTNEFGIQISNGATTSRLQGNKISNNTLVGAASAPFASSSQLSSAGIFLVNDNVTTAFPEVIAGNTLTGNDVGILVQGTQGVITKNSTSLTIQNNTISSSYGYAGIDLLDSGMALVLNNSVSHNLAYNGIALVNATDVTLRGNTVNNNGVAGSMSDGIYDVEGNGDLIVSNQALVNSGNGINLQSAVGDVVTNDVVNGNAEYGVMDVGGSTKSITGTVANSNKQGGFYLNDVSGLTLGGNQANSNIGDGFNLVNVSISSIVNNNALSNSSNGLVITLNNSSSTIENNHANHNGGFGLSLSGANGGVLESNVAANNAGDGLDLSSDSGSVFYGNEALQNSGNGITITASSYARITHNIANQNHGYGLALSLNNTSSVILGNAANQNSSYGINLSNIHGGTFSGNTAVSNVGDGLDLQSVSGLILTGNVFNRNGLNSKGKPVALANGITLVSDVTQCFFTGNQSDFNSADGLLVEDSTSTGNAFTQNQIQYNSHQDIMDKSTGSAANGTGNDYYANHYRTGN